MVKIFLFNRDSQGRENRARLRLAAKLAACLLLTLPAAVRATTYGDIDVNLASVPRGNSWHGYFEYVILVTNRSEERAYTVGLAMPYEKQIMRDDYIRELRRTVRVGAKETVRVTLLQPDYPPVGGSDLIVTIDDRRQERETPLTPNQRRRGGGYRPYYGYSSSTGEPLVLMSPSIRKSFPIAGPSAPGSGMMGGPAVGMPGMPPGPGGMHRMEKPPPAAPAMPGLSANTQFARAEAVVNWSAHWLGYSRYDGIVVTGDDLKVMSPAVRTALWQYVETGGSLLVLGKADLRGLAVTRREETKDGWDIAEAGFGQCLVSPDDNIDKWDNARLGMLEKSWRETAAPWQETRGRNSYEAHMTFPVVEDLGVPVKGLFVLMLLFTLAIGPINFIVLARQRRRIWLLWTTPVISFLTCLAVLGYMLISEGWEGHLRSETLTLLDESAHRATTIGWTAVYSPLTPGDGLHFSYDTEVVPMRMHEGRGAGVRSCTIDWSRDQHFAAGWVEARVPAHFKVRTSETRSLRVAIHRDADQKLSMVNELGVAIHRFCYADADGMLYTAEQIAPGASVSLTPKGQEVPPRPAETLRQVLGGNWLMSIQSLAQNPSHRLRPRSYLAELDDSPFLEGALRNARTRKCHALVLGISKEDNRE
jgi:hypothetical protein